MQMTHIQVVKLYGLHNYDITFATHERLKIIHAPNGYGKTTILKLVRDILEGHYSKVYSVPFESFTITFEGDKVLKIFKTQHLFYLFTEGGRQELFEIILEQSTSQEERLKEKLKHLQEEMPIYFIDANRLWTEKREEQEKTTALLPTVLEYARELSDWMRAALAEANYCGQALDRSFPS